jgi:hypothetical protein
LFGHSEFIFQEIPGMVIFFQLFKLLLMFWSDSKYTGGGEIGYGGGRPGEKGGEEREGGGKEGKRRGTHENSFRNLLREGARNLSR